MELVFMFVLYKLICVIWPDTDSPNGNDVFIPFDDKHNNSKEEFEDRAEYHRYENEDFGEF